MFRSDLPLQDLLRNPSSVLGEVAPREETTTIYTICRRGNDSLTAACIINKLKTQNEQYEWLQVRDVRGGVRAWSRDVDPSFPTY
jgi:adenylyltransferase/sulfurtransferase